MNERTIFEKAIEIDDPQARAQYIEQATAGDVALRQRIESLIASHERDGGMLDELSGLWKGSSATISHDSSVESSDVGRTDLGFLEPCSTAGTIGALGNYEVLELIGRGGMGVVLRARDTKLQRIVAIKVLAPEIAANVAAKRRFHREAQAAAAVSHDHVVTIHAVEELNGLPFIVMECIVGRTLQQKIDQTGPLELKEILRIALQTAHGLAAAHEQGLVHRDIKPANILLQNGIQRVKISDFGLARATDDVDMTHTGQIAGTPLYMSPEQAQGKRVDHLSDLFSFGSVIYTMCTGRPAFRADSSVAVLRRVCDDAPRPIHEVNPDLPAWLVQIVDKLLAKEKCDRHQTAAEVAAVLSERLARLQEPSSTGVAADPDHAPMARTSSSNLAASAAANRMRRSRVWPWLVLALLALSLGGWIAKALLFDSSAAGALVIDTDVENAVIRITRDNETVVAQTTARRINLPSGNYRVELVSDDARLRISPEQVTVEPRVTVPIRIWRQNAADPQPAIASANVPAPADDHAASSADAMDSAQQTSNAPPPKLDAAAPHVQPWSCVPLTASVFGNGAARADGDTLVVQSDGGGFQTLFGDRYWQDIDFQVDCLQEEGHGNVFLYFRCADADNRRQITLGSFANQYLGADLWVDGNWSGLAGHPWSLRPDEWNTVRIEVRGTHAKTYVDGEPQLAADTPVHSQGMIGVGIGKGRARFRNIKVTEPNGETLWDGIPSIFIPPSNVALNPQAIPESERFAWQPQELVGVIGNHSLNHWGPVSGVAASGGGDALLSTGDDGVWLKPAIKRPAEYFPDRDNCAISATWHSNLGFLTVHRDGTVNRWFTDSPVRREPLWQLPADTRSIRISEDGRVLVGWVVPGTKWNDIYKLPHLIGEAVVFDVNGSDLTERCRMPRTGPPAITPNGRWLTYHNEQAKQIERRDLDAPESPVVARQTFDSPVRYIETPRDDRLVTQTIDQQLQWWAFADDGLHELASIKLTGHSGDYTGLSISADGTRIALVRFDTNQFEMFEVRDDELVATSTIHVPCNAGMHTGVISADGRMLVAGTDMGGVRYLHFDQGNIVFDSRPEDLLLSERHTKLSPNPSQMTSGNGSVIGLLHSAPRGEIWSLTSPAPLQIPPPQGDNPFGSPVTAISDDGALALLPSGRQERDLWRFANGVFNAIALPDELQPGRACFSDDGRLIAATPQGELVIYDVSMRLVEPLAKSKSLGDEYVWSVAFQRGTSRAVALSQAKNQPREFTLRVFDLQNNRFGELYSKSLSNVTPAISRFGNHLALAYQDMAVEYFEIQAETLKKLGEIQLAAPASTIDISPSGDRLLTVAPDHEVRIWETAHGRQISQWQFPGRISNALFLGTTGVVLTINSNLTAYVLRPGDEALK